MLDTDQTLDLRDQLATRKIVTGAGKERIWANAQDNIIWGREGGDIINGDAGCDTFRVDLASNEAVTFSRDQWDGVVNVPWRRNRHALQRRAYMLLERPNDCVERSADLLSA